MGKHVGMLLLASWMILIGISLMTGVVYPVLSLVLAVLAIATGTLVLWCWKAEKHEQNSSRRKS